MKTGFNKTAAEFTMFSGGFSWMVKEVNDDIDVQAMGIENYVRWMAKDHAESNSVDYKAKPETIYRVWRAGGEFERAVAEIKQYFKELNEPEEQPDLYACPECRSLVTFYTQVRSIECPECQWRGQSLGECVKLNK